MHMFLNHTQTHTWKYKLHSQWSRSEEIRASIFLNWSSFVFGSPLTIGVLNLGEWHITHNIQYSNSLMMGKVAPFKHFTYKQIWLLTWDDQTKNNDHFQVNTGLMTPQNTNSFMSVDIPAMDMTQFWATDRKCPPSKHRAGMAAVSW